MELRKEEDLKSYTDNYQSQVMSEEGIARMKERIAQAKVENRQDKIMQLHNSQTSDNNTRILPFRSTQKTGSLRRKRIYTTAASAAAALLLIIALPNTSPKIAYAMEQIPVLGNVVSIITFRDYTYESERNHADIEVPEIVIDEAQITENNAAELAKSADEINAEIQKISEQLIEEFKTQAANELGYQDVLVKSEVIKTTEDYFTLKLICYEGAGSGYEWNRYYTIDLNTGKRLSLKDIFTDGADYITPISENIKKQMQEQMDADEMVSYWLDDEIEDGNFQSITEDTSFYLDENNNLVICFDEGDVAPMYMGTVSFTIPSKIISAIRK